MLRRGVYIVVALLLTAMAAGQAGAACTAITTAQGLDNVRNDITGSYCLRNDIDLHGANFKPIVGFFGSLDGGGHAIRNLTINSDLSLVGLFTIIQDGATVRNVNLAGVRVTSTFAGALVGSLAGLVTGDVHLTNIRVSGWVRCTGAGCRAGGLIGQTDDLAEIVMVSSAASVASGNGGAAGGIAGQIGGLLRDSYATGPVGCGNNCAVGGLVGWAEETSVMMRTFASGPVLAGKDGAAGGLAGFGVGSTLQSYATGAVKAGLNSTAGLLGAKGGRISEVFAAGPVHAANGSEIGGLFALREPPDKAVSSAYWDSVTTGQATSNGGVAKTTTQLRAAKPQGFGAAWGITKGASYPYLTNANLDFKSTLATLVAGTLLYTFLPIGQLEPTEYSRRAAHADEASLAAVYTMLARAVGVTSNVGALKGVKIDKYFWDDATATTSFAGPLTAHATLGALRTIGAATPLSEANVVGALRGGRTVILRGSYRKRSGRDFVTAQHWLLATLFINNGRDQMVRVVANDPYTGRQVLIDPASKRVTLPGFPLAGFTVDGYRVVTLN